MHPPIPKSYMVFRNPQDIYFMVWEVPKSEKWPIYVFFFIFCKGGISENLNLYWKIGENDFLSITRQKCIIGQNELGSSNKWI